MANTIARQLDLGDLSGKQSLLFFGGCYSNLAATKALQQWAIDNAYSPDQCFCSGDIVAYCAEPVETIALIRDWGVPCIQGNVEQSLANNIDDCGCGFESGTTCDILSKGWFPYADRLVQKPDRQWFASLPEHISFTFAGKQCLLVHGAVSDVSRFMFASHPNQRFNEEFSQSVNADIIIAGHSGLPFTKVIDNSGENAESLENLSNSNKNNSKIWHNSGAIGMPANDGSDVVWFSTISIVENHDTDTHQIEIEHHSIAYDAELTNQNMISNNLVQGYHEAILSGKWPSMDVLPEAEKQQVGQTLRLSKLRL